MFPAVCVQEGDRPISDGPKTDAGDGVKALQAVPQPLEHLPVVDGLGVVGNPVLPSKDRHPAALLTQLRQAGLKAGMDYAGRSMKAQMKQANKANARFALIIGEDEVKESCVMLKDMEKSEQQKVSFDTIIEKLCAEVKG